MGLIKDASPRAGILDLWDYIRQRREHNLLLWVTSCVPIVLVIIGFNYDNIKLTAPPPPTVTYFESWPADRSLDETVAAITKRQAEKDAFLEKKREGYKTLGRAMGMDVEQIEKEAAQNRADADAQAATKERTALTKPGASQ
jgi:hypothetical protein